MLYTYRGPIVHKWRVHTDESLVGSHGPVRAEGKMTAVVTVVQEMEHTDSYERKILILTFLPRTVITNLP